MHTYIEICIYSVVSTDNNGWQKHPLRDSNPQSSD